MNNTAEINDRIRVMTSDDLEQVLDWRNHLDVRSHMYTQHKITFNEHKRWFEQAAQNPSKHLLIFEADGIPLGFVSFNQLDKSPIVDWGFYTAPHAPKGSGARLGRVAINYAFIELELHKVCGQVLASNERSIRFHEKLGFHKEGLLRDQYFNGRLYCDVLCFGLLVSEWQANN